MQARDEPGDDAGLSLTFFLPGQPGQTHRLEPGRRYAVGRSPEADLRLDHASVSRVHLLLEDAGTGWRVTDQVSKNGTRLDGRPIDRAVISSPGWLEAGGIAMMVRPGAAEVHDSGRLAAGEGETGPERGGANSDSLDRAVHEIARLSRCERAGVWTVLEDGRCRPLVQLGQSEPPPSMTAICRASTNGRSEFCSDTEGARALAGSGSIATGGIRALLAMPIVRGEKAIAVAYADSLEPGRLFTRHDAELLEAITRQLALILATDRVQRHIQALRHRL